MIQNRRSFLGALTSLAAASFLPDASAWASNGAAGKLHFASNEYSWITFYERQQRDWFADLDASIGEFAKSGIAGYEPSVTNVEQLHQLAPLLKKYKIEMRSVYVGCTLHKEREGVESLKQVTAIAKAAAPLGVKIIVTNPSPIRWGGEEDKTDAELSLQAGYLNKMGAELQKHGITLAYHNHDIEMRRAAREFHHMMVATDPRLVSLCLEAHWLYRGSGNSQLALFDVMRLYGNRIAEVHLRQSKNGTWSETFGEGDIDYTRLAKELLALKVRPHLVLEQCVEEQTPNTMGAVEAHQLDLQYAQRIFG
ncbi:sugar phosphate isomerase/epimerase [Pontibacter sp. E15-1]|uniref:sugar phosphate isomerase/epimerase family protein n=1 Tax=Pontibacter sp. E15-1 TaxID=2919918 RepID=UPI001F4F4463|nr:sugar phosphate isomerase/epimerase [Pontibacter sp. E15-1]MCJ8163319.1 sugar phosphate isomerase/epimerase [Pontibacter sp. E15-1]